MTDPTAPATPYEEFGGEEFFTRLVAGFYRRVATDPVLKPMYPDDDMAGAERRLRMFLMQYWGGPGTYSEERGHPALRMRHAPFPIDAVARDRWLALMHESMAEMDLPEEQDARLWMYLIGAAFAMQNIADDFPPTGGSIVGQVQP
jgi:hemoglobin